jgi:hypothetical protein
MDKQISRRSFLRTSALALGAIALSETKGARARLPRNRSRPRSFSRTISASWFQPEVRIELPRAHCRFRPGGMRFGGTAHHRSQAPGGLRGGAAVGASGQAHSAGGYAAPSGNGGSGEDRDRADRIRQGFADLVRPGHRHPFPRRGLRSWGRWISFIVQGLSSRTRPWLRWTGRLTFSQPDFRIL